MSKFVNARFPEREKARKCNEPVEKRTVAYFRKIYKCSIYRLKEKVYVQIGDKKRALKKHYILTGTIT